MMFNIVIDTLDLTRQIIRKAKDETSGEIQTKWTYICHIIPLNEMCCFLLFLVVLPLGHQSVFRTNS